MKKRTKNQEIAMLEEIIFYFWRNRDCGSLGVYSMKKELQERLKPIQDAVAAIPLIVEEEMTRHRMSRRDWYRNVYLQSDHWDMLRDKAIKHYGGKCSECGSFLNIQVHHTNYKNIYDVTVEDLQLLCKKCHNSKHPDKRF